MSNNPATSPPPAPAASPADLAYERQLREMNDALLVSSVRQNELAELAEKANAVVRESERRYREMVDALPAAVYTTDAQGRLTHANRAAIEFAGRTPDFETDRWCLSHKMYRPDGTPLPHDQCPMALALKEGRAIRGEEVIVERPDGTRRLVEPYPTPLRNAQGQVVGGINMLVDITERSRLERKTQEQSAALTDLHRRKDEFLAMLSHELRNPLAPILNAVQLLGLAKDESRLQRKARTIIERQVTQLARLVDDLMEVSRITTGKVQLRRERLIVNGIVEHAIETVRPLVEQHQHELTVSLAPEPIWLDADAARLEQVLVNLLINAAKYTHEGGRIGISVEQEGHECVLRVRDTGVGIAPELLPHIFDLFTQAERSLARSQGGLGIGLALAQRLTILHGGKIEAHSVLGEGSEFVVRLPVAPTDAPQQSPSVLETSQPATCPLRVLVVDDNVDAAEALGMLLKEKGHDVRTAHDAPAALEAARDLRPNVVLLDIGLPGMDGYEVARTMRRQPTLKNVVLVALTGYGQEADRERSQAAGFDHYLVKPADFKKVQQILATVSEQQTSVP